MKIAIDVRTVLKRRSGVGNYVLNSIKSLQKIDHENEYYFLCRRENLEILKKEGIRISEKNIIPTLFSHENHLFGDLWEHTILPLRLKKKNIDIFHGPAFLIPFISLNYKTIVTIHDLVAFLIPDTIPVRYAVYMRSLIRFTSKRACCIIADSKNTKNDLISILNTSPDKIKVIYAGISDIFHPVKDRLLQEKVLRKHGIKKPFLYFIGNIEPRKNIARLIKAVHRARVISGIREIHLVISGMSGWLIKKIYDQLTSEIMGDHIHFTNYIPSEEIPVLMSAARAFVFPTLYEGFGFPVLEAMKCGTPVLSSNISSIPEIVGEAAILVNPRNIEEISDGIIRIWTDRELREELKVKGLKQAKEFTWEKTGQEILALYSEIGNRTG